MKMVLAAIAAVLGAGACGEPQSASYSPEPYTQQEARRDAQRLPPAEMPNPDIQAPVTPTLPRPTDPIDPTDPLAQPPGSPPPVLPAPPQN